LLYFNIFNIQSCVLSSFILYIPDDSSPLMLKHVASKRTNMKFSWSWRFIIPFYCSYITMGCNW